MKNAYTAAGVDVNAGYEVVDRIKEKAKKTNRFGMMGSLGGFGGCFDISQFQLKEPVLVSGTDGVGTKLLLAIEANQHETIGIDCVAMCVNDILAQGAEPLYFLDYLATGKTKPEKVEKIVSGVIEGCSQANCGLIGGETAEMPDMYTDDEYDLAGFSVGIAEKTDLLTPDKVKVDDVLIGLPSSGIHSNGYSLVRKIFFKDHDYQLSDVISELDNQRLVDELLKPTRIYVSAVLPLIKKGLVNGISHITGGGFIENLPRMLTNELAVEIQKESWSIPAIFTYMEDIGQIAEEEMYEIFNMGIGMVLAVSPEKVSQLKEELTKMEEPFFEIGKITLKESEAVVFKEVNL